jgi:hypothetical protein
MNQVNSIDMENSAWKTLYRIGGIAPLVALGFYLVQIFILIFGEPFPSTAEGWFSLLQRSKPLGLLYLNALDIFSIAFLGTMFLALYIVLRRVHESYMAIAAFFAFLGTSVFVAPRVAMLSLLPLSDQYAAAATDAQRSQILSAAQALGSLGMPTPQTIGFLFMAIAVIIISAVMLRSNIFGKATAFAGILASVITFADDLSMVIAPSMAAVLMPVSGLLWILWWILISRRLLKLGSGTSE